MNDTEKMPTKEMQQQAQAFWDKAQEYASHIGMPSLLAAFGAVRSEAAQDRIADLERKLNDCKLSKTEWRARYVLAKDKAEMKLAEARKVMPNPDKLRILADWIDMKYPNDIDPVVQNDLRKWANEVQQWMKDNE